MLGDPIHHNIHHAASCVGNRTYAEVVNVVNVVSPEQGVFAG
jgi:hypothetical protein